MARVTIVVEDARLDSLPEAERAAFVEGEIRKGGTPWHQDGASIVAITVGAAPARDDGSPESRVQQMMMMGRAPGRRGY